MPYVCGTATELQPASLSNRLYRELATTIADQRYLAFLARVLHSDLGTPGHLIAQCCDDVEAGVGLQDVLGDAEALLGR